MQTYLDCVFAIFLVMRSIARLSFLCAWVVSLAILDLVKINGIFPKLREDEGHRVLDPESLPFERRACLELLVVLDGIGYFATALRSFFVDRVVEVAGPFIADSHGKKKRFNGSCPRSSPLQRNVRCLAVKCRALSVRSSEKKNGGDYGIRTHDPLLAKQVL